MSTGSASPPEPKGLKVALDHMAAHKIETLLWVTRLTTVCLTVAYFIPIFGGNPFSIYQKALLSNAATSALRLHQRLPQVQFNREFLALLLLEDSCHYIFYSVMFVFAYPITMVLFPVFLFALLHSASFTITILTKLGSNNSWLARNLKIMIDQHQRNILRMVAFTEIFLMPCIIGMLFSGRGSLLTGFVFYRFLTLRYASRRNPYTRNVFYELRIFTEMQIARPGCPEMIRRLCQKAIVYISRLAPPVPTS